MEKKHYFNGDFPSSYVTNYQRLVIIAIKLNVVPQDQPRDHRQIRKAALTAALRVLAALIPAACHHYLCQTAKHVTTDDSKTVTAFLCIP